MNLALMILSLISVFLNISGKDQPDYIGSMNVNDILAIEYIAGDESTEFNKIEISKTNQGLFAKRIGKILYVGDKAEENWIKQVDESQKELINDFINESTSQKQGDYWSSWREEYLITLNNDTISNLLGNHEWGLERYYSFEKNLFEEEFDKLARKRTRLIEDLDQKIEGKWLVIGFSSTLKRGAKVQLQRSGSEGEDCVWVFPGMKNFYSQCSKIDLDYSNGYDWDVDEGSIFLKIKPGYTSAKSSNLKNYGATFKVEEAIEENVTLEFLWR